MRLIRSAEEVERPPDQVLGAARPSGELGELGTSGCARFDVFKPGDCVPVDVGGIAAAQLAGN